jgi:signal transduction histidine kinase
VSPRDLREDAGKKTRKRSIRDPTQPLASLDNPEQSSRRLEHMYEIGKLFARFENVEQPLDPALAIVTKSLPLMSAILIEIHDDRSRLIVWPTSSQSSEHMRAVQEHAEAACKYLVGVPSTEIIDLTLQTGRTRLPWQPRSDDTLASMFIVLPLVVSNRPPFGILQLESAEPLDKADLMFVNAIANQLAIAIDRDRAWQRDIKLRALAEDGRVRAEVTSAAAERDRAIAESAREEYAGLARENSGLYEQAQKAVRAREQVLEVVSHDLKNPLGAILMITGILDEKAASADRRPDYPAGVARIQRAAQSMLRLIEDLLDFASIDSGHLALNREPQDAGSLIHETLASFASVAQAKHLEMTADVEPKLPSVLCDRGRILQVLSNLVGNATLVTADGGRIKLRVVARENKLVFAVEDNGPGIGEEDVRHLFDRYWRSSQAEYKGTGLGLAIANEIIRAHGSRIAVDSELGRGTTFCFTLAASNGIVAADGGGETIPT